MEGREVCRKEDRQAGRQAGRQTDRQTYRSQSLDAWSTVTITVKVSAHRKLP